VVDGGEPGVAIADTDGRQWLWHYKHYSIIVSVGSCLLKCQCVYLNCQDGECKCHAKNDFYIAGFGGAVLYCDLSHSSFDYDKSHITWLAQ